MNGKSTEKEGERLGAAYHCFAQLSETVSDFLWGRIGLLLLLGSGILTTVRSGGFQFFHLKLWWRCTAGSLFSRENVSHSRDKGAISPFQSLCTALAATIGTGNIAGVAAAICFGGPGAVFWMWIAAAFGMMTGFAENVLGIYFRRKNKDGEWTGGPMYTLRDGVGGRFGRAVANVFSLLACIAAFGVGNISQSNKIVANIAAAFDIPTFSHTVLYADVTLYSVLLGIGLTVLVGSIVAGGLQRVASFAEKIVPIMVLLYIAGSLAVIGINSRRILPAMRAIFVSAFNPTAVTGGTGGYCLCAVITHGLKRGCYSNEAGLGSSVIVHANSALREPVVQGMWSLFEVFTDTIVVCTMTALVVLTSGVFDLSTGKITVSGVTDATLVAASFNAAFPWGDIGEKFVAVALFLFALTPILGWSHYGAKAAEYLWGEKILPFYRGLFIIAVTAGAVLTSSLAWGIADLFNALMMIPNVIGVILLCPLVDRITENYLARHENGKTEKPLLSFDETIQATAESAILSASFPSTEQSR